MLLKRGVPVQVSAPLFLRCFGKKRINYSLQLPKFNTLLRIAEMYLNLDIDASKTKTVNEAIALMRLSGKSVAKIIAIALLNGKRQWSIKWLAKRLSKSLTSEQMYYLFTLIVVHGGIEDFMSTIRLIEKTRITKPMNLSQKTGS